MLVFRTESTIGREPARSALEVPILGVLLLVVAVGVLLMLTSSGEVARTVGGILTPAFVGGVVGFALGFFGPMIVTPGAGQGPLLGIFITGPLGFVLGLAFGAWRLVWGGAGSGSGTG